MFNPFPHLIPERHAQQGAAFPAPTGEPEEALALKALIRDKQLTAVFQPILDCRAHSHMGFEGLIQGPEKHPLHSPDALFSAARRNHLSLELEHACRETILEAFARLRLPGKLFINASPACLLDPRFKNGETLAFLRQLGLPPSRIVIELTENQQITDFPEIQATLAHFRSLGYQIAIDDLGEGFSNLRMWSEIRPEYVKIDRHFITGIGQDDLKFQFVKAMQDLAETCSAHIIAEGIESAADLQTVRDLGIAHGQGYFIARPRATPSTCPDQEVLDVLCSRRVAVFPQAMAGNSITTARTLLHYIEPISCQADNDQVFLRFENDPQLEVLPVVEGETPVGLINRHTLIDRFARPFRRELYGKKPCTLFMDPAPLVVDENATVQELGLILSRAARHYLFDGFIVTSQGRYTGVGSGHDLMVLITEMQISAARYANPLTQLPGNVPINEHIDRLLKAGVRFAACYADLDNFKPFNDIYGYRRGDDVIQLLGQILVEVADARLDFVGHIGGDDFLILFQSNDWEARCARALKLFDERVLPIFSAEDLQRGGLLGENRHGEVVLHPLPALSIGALMADSCHYESHHEIATAAADAKKQAKKQRGSSLFIERRRPYPASPASRDGQT
ncbi:GGDEF domain-containing protein [Azovibrio restrictus]|uniref:GGDEF domain-containing protein n=1 Tax=Azovibrio restrictus TaxID=146938 RepID=UPI0026EF3926|nr:GGDEF domain-containing protein [Azovibrio restrictus]